MTTGLIINHLWQSSCFVLFAALLAVALRKNPPKVRYWVWLSASLKFLVPWTLLVSVGNLIPWPAQQVQAFSAPAFSSVIVGIAQPFSAPSASVPQQSPLQWLPALLGILWTLGFVAIATLRFRSWIRIQKVARTGTPVELPISIPAVIASSTDEPGIVGFLRPVLVLPAHLLERLNPRQLDAILAHELCHVRRHDNFFAAVHMVVEAIFWFHPLVWWIGSRMVEERELACDEAVLQMGCEPADYVEGILEVCRLYQESPLPCVSGVTGADVKKRLRSILAGHTSRELTRVNKFVLAAIGIAATTAPILIGILNAPQLQAQSVPPVGTMTPTTPNQPSAPLTAQAPPAPRTALVAAPAFATISIKRSASAWIFPHAIDALRFEAVSTLHQLIQWAYGLGRDFQVSGGPDWLGAPYFDGAGTRVWPVSQLFEIRATTARPSSEIEMKQMLQFLLATRFNLRVHRESRQLPVYAIVIAPNGPNLPPAVAPESCPVPAGECGFPNVGGPDGGTHTITARGGTMAGFAILLTNNVDRPVIDKTGLTAGYSFFLPYEHSGSGWRTGAAIFPAIQTLGLRLEPQTEMVDMLVVDGASLPTGN